MQTAGKIAEAIILTWKADDHIRHEFRNDLTTFASFVQNKGDEGLELVGLAHKDQLHHKKERDMEKYFDEVAAIQTWERDPKLREEFGGNKEAYLAFAKANAQGLVKIQGRKVGQD